MNRRAATAEVAVRPRVLSLVRQKWREQAEAAGHGRPRTGSGSMIRSGGGGGEADDCPLLSNLDVAVDARRARRSANSNRLVVLEALVKINAAARRQLQCLPAATGVPSADRRRLAAELRSITSHVQRHLFDVADAAPSGGSYAAAHASLYALEARFNAVGLCVASFSPPPSTADGVGSGCAAAIGQWLSKLGKCFRS